MSTQAQINANRENAEKSTGPKTAEGKAASSKNATRHGFYSKEFQVREEEREAFTRLPTSTVNPCKLLIRKDALFLLGTTLSFSDEPPDHF